MKKYNHQAILNLENDLDEHQKWLKNRISKEQSINVQLISNIEKETIIPVLKNFDNKSRLYIFAHGSSQDSSVVADKADNGEEWSYKELAKLLKINLSHLSLKIPINKALSSRKLKISLMVCYGGTNSNDRLKHLNSFAGKLQKELAQAYKIYIDINARVTLVNIDQYLGKPTTFKLGSESKRKQIQQNIKELISKEQYTKAKEVIDRYNLRKQPKSKFAFRLLATENKKFMQVAYEAYQLKEHENIYHQLNSLIEKLKSYAKQKNEKGYKDAAKAAHNLAEKIKDLTNIYFNGINKNKTQTNNYKISCSKLINEANVVLEKNRDALSKRIAGKALLAIGSVLIAPLLIHKALVKKEFSQGLFSNKTTGKQITEIIESAIKRIKPIEEVEKQSIELQQKVSLNLN